MKSTTPLYGSATSAEDDATALQQLSQFIDERNQFESQQKIIADVRVQLIEWLTEQKRKSSYYFRLADGEDAITCPITLAPVVDPVRFKTQCHTTLEGKLVPLPKFINHIFERFALERWLLEHSTDPLNGKQLENPIELVKADDLIQESIKPVTTLKHKGKDSRNTNALTVAKKPKRGSLKYLLK